MKRIHWPTVIISLVASLVVTGGVATAGSLITTSQIKKGAVTEARLSPNVRKKLNARATNGLNGINGVDGVKGAHGATGASGIDGTNGADGLNADSSRTVTASNLQGFLPAPDGDNTPTYGGSDNDGAHGTISFDTAPTTPVAPSGAETLLGTKALHVNQSINGKSMATFLPFKKTKLSELSDLSYSTLVTNRTSNASEDVSIQMEVLGTTSTAFASGYGTLVYEPAFNGTAGSTTWHRNDARHGKFWFTKASTTSNPSDCTIPNPCTLETFVAENPNTTISSLKLRNGQNNGGVGPGFEAWVDNITIGFGTATNYDLGG